MLSKHNIHICIKILFVFVFPYTYIVISPFPYFNSIWFVSFKIYLDMVVCQYWLHLVSTSLSLLVFFFITSILWLNKQSNKIHFVESNSFLFLNMLSISATPWSHYLGSKVLFPCSREYIPDDAEILGMQYWCWALGNIVPMPRSWEYSTDAKILRMQYRCRDPRTTVPVLRSWECCPDPVILGV